MKYLREYNDHNNSYIQLNIDRYAFDSVLYDNCISDFTPEEFVKIEDNFLDCNVEQDTHYASLDDGHTGYDWRDIDSIIVNFKKKNIVSPYIKIFKATDEWYYIQSLHYDSNITYYKCDQWNGLVDCFNMLKKKYKL